MNITQLARQVRMSTKELRAALPMLGFDIGARAIKVDNKAAQAIIRKLGNRVARERLLHELRVTEAGAEEVKEEVKAKSAPGESGELLLPSEVVVKDLAKQMDVNVTKLVVELMKQGVMASLNDRIDYETAAVVADDFGFVTKLDEAAGVNKVITTDEQLEKLIEAQSSQTRPRAPVVVVMGHVDHGKTKLLDAIRKTDVVAEESGGITQHIGAYQVSEKGQKITFIDTPGHEAFSMMRSRGAKVADLAVLVVAADDGVQPQTIEAISHIRNAELPFVVAINKVDKAEANQDKVKKELSELGLNPEEWSGDTIMVPISAKQGQNIHGLLESLLLVYEVAKENITADPQGLPIGTVIESHVDKSAGPVATVLIRNGTLRRGDQVLVGDHLGKVRTMRDWHGRDLEEAEPSTPVAILGLKQVPQVGEVLKREENVSEVRRARRMRRKQTVPAAMQKVLRSEEAAAESEATVNLSIKADVLGSLEAIQDSLEKIGAQGITVNLVAKGLGHITEADVLRAQDASAVLLGFKARSTPEAEELARTKEVILHSYDVIYDLLDFVAEHASKIMNPDVIRHDLGSLKVLKIFKQEDASVVLGGEVVSGKVAAEAKAELVRGGKVISQGELVELQFGKEKVMEVVEGQQAGLQLKGLGEISAGDILRFYHEEKQAKKVET